MEETLLAHINRAHGTTFALVQRYAGGEQGAYALIDAAGAAFALKFSPDLSALGRLRQAAATTDQLRARGYPAPRYVVIGATATISYAIQTALPGAPLFRLAAQHIPDVLALNALQGRAAPPGPRTWPTPVIAPTLNGGPGFCLLDPMRAHSAETAALLECLQGIVRTHAALDLPQSDIVHFDFTPRNILSDGTAISGVIDWDGACAGDRAFDLATLLFYTHTDTAIADALAAAARAQAGPGAVALYLAHLAHRQVDWAIRHYDAPTAAYWIQIAQQQVRRYAL